MATPTLDNRLCACGHRARRHSPIGVCHGYDGPPVRVEVVGARFDAKLRVTGGQRICKCRSFIDTDGNLTPRA